MADRIGRPGRDECARPLVRHLLADPYAGWVTEDKLDVVLYGATGFVGKLTAAYLLRAAPADTRIGLAGRSREKLEEVRHRLGGPASDWPLIVADSADRGALDEMVGRATSVATTVGPYSKYGLPL